MQQGGGGAAGGGSQFGISPPPDMPPYTTTASSTTTATSATSGMLQHQFLQQQLKSGDHMVVEAASPISSRPPAAALIARPSNFDDLVTAAAASSGAGGFQDDEGFGGDEGLDRSGAGGGNRWPRQETMALLKIRSEMDVVFRDATLKGPLWEDVSRKLAQQGYTRSAKKCKEKFENVHKYYKRTKEGRAGRQDGKSYRFFSQLEALHTTPTAVAAPPVTVATTAQPPSTPVSIGIGMVGAASGRPQTQGTDLSMPPAAAAATTTTASAPPPPTQIGVSIPMDLSGGMHIGAPESSNTQNAPAAAAGGISFSSNTSSAESEDSDDELLEAAGVPSNTTSRKRKRESSAGGDGSRKMMDFFEGLMKQVMEKQESMQQRFLETIEKREQDRMIREEAWKRQEMARLAREHEIMAQERAISASRDAAIIAFLQKITGQQIQFTPQLIIPAAPPPAPPQPQPQRTPPPSTQPQPPPPPPTQPLPPPPTQQSHPQPPQQSHPQPPPQPQQQQQHHHPHTPQPQQQKTQQHHTPQLSQSTEIVRHQPTSTDVVVAAIPEQQHPPLPLEMVGASGGGFDSPSSRWPKQEVLALIKLRSGLESRYQEAGPKGPLWEEISTGMHRMGYNRSSKRCKEKWENINKYFKKVKESNKKRPEDAKTCPYFHQLDALYRKKMIGGSGSSSFGHQSKPEDSMAVDSSSPAPSNFQAIMPPSSLAQPPSQAATEAENKNNSRNNNVGGVEQEQQNNKEGQGMFEEGNSATALKKPEDIMKDLMERQHQQQLMANYDKMEERDSDHIDPDDEFDDEDDYDDEDDEEAEEESKMAYKIQFQRQNAAGSSSSNGGGNVPNPFLAMVQ